MKRIARFVAAAFAGVAVWAGVMTPPGPKPARAADHGDAPNVDGDSGADIADVFLFLDPADNTKVCILGTIHGFITPGEAQNFGTFDANVQYRFDIENTGDFKADQSILITFDERTAAGAPQTATVRLPNKKTFTAQTTPPTLTTQPAPQNVQLNVNNTGVDFFAGIVDDPFFFDIPAFQRFVASVRAGTPDAALLSRGRDTFAGYNVMGIAMRMPLSMVQSSKPSPTTQKIGLEMITSRKTQTVQGKNGVIKGSGKFRQADRMGNPAVNVALIPFGKKSAFNAATPKDDAAGKFQADILASLAPFGTDNAHVQALAGLVITNGDYIRMDPSIPNSGPKGGTNPEAAYPNGRRLADDTIDIILTVINNGNALGDSVDGSDFPPQDQFPFFALPHQPLENPPGGVETDDQTRN